MKKLLLAALILPMISLAQIHDPKPNTYVNDFANVLTVDQVQKLNEKILSIEKKSSVQIAVIILPELPANLVIEDYALEVGRKWHVGNAKNGLVYIASLKERKQRLEVADNMQGAIPDIEALHITDEIKPFFRANDFFGGINQLLDGINKNVDPVLKEQQALAEAEQKKKNEKMNGDMVNMFFCILMLAAISFATYRIYFLPKIRKRREAARAAEIEQEKKYQTAWRNRMNTMINTTKTTGTASKRSSEDIAPYIPPPPSRSSDNDYTSPSRNNDNDNFGNWGSGSSDNNSGSGFSGGGANNDW